VPSGWEAGQQTTDLRRAMTTPRRHHPDPAELASRASDLAARVAMLVSEATELESQTADLSSYLGSQPAGTLPPYAGEVLSRAEQVRRTAARLAGNAPRGWGAPPQRRPDDSSRRY
jgi:hypothetical protein